MNKKIKIIELLNKIANGEEVPRHIKYECYQYDWRDNANDYICEDADGERLSMFDDGYICILCNSLNDEVVILEDNTEEIEGLKYEETNLFDDKGNILETQYILRDEDVIKTINELVKAVNKMKEGKE